MLISDTISNARSAYERQFAGQIGVTHAVAFGHARTGLRAIFSALELNPGDEVVLSPLTCRVVPLALLSLKLKPVYADVSPATLNLDPAAVHSAIGPATRAVLFQHTYGNPGGLVDVARVASTRQVSLIEDRAQCLPRPAAPIVGQAAVYSNNLLKPLPAASGGVAVTNDRDLAKKLGSIAGRLPGPDFQAKVLLWAETWVHRHVLRPELYWPALNLSGRFHDHAQPLEREIDAQITACAHVPSARQMREGSRWLAGVEEWARRRSESCAEYRALLADCAQIPSVDFTEPLFYFPIRTRHKSAVLREAQRRRVELIAWPKSTPIYPVESAAQLRTYGFDPDSCPTAIALARELIGLPTHDRITARHRRRIATLLRSFHV